MIAPQTGKGPHPPLSHVPARQEKELWPEGLLETGRGWWGEGGGVVGEAKRAQMGHAAQPVPAGWVRPRQPRDAGCWVTSGKGSQKVWAPSQLCQRPVTDLSLPQDSLSSITLGPFLASSLSLPGSKAKAFNTPVLRGHLGLVAKGPGQTGSAPLQARPRPRLPGAPKTTTSGSRRVQRPCLSTPPFLCLCHEAPDCCSLDLAWTSRLKKVTRGPACGP